MGGKSSQENRTQSTTKQDPWYMQIPALGHITSAVTEQFPNAQVTGNEQNALEGLTANAQAGNPYAPQIGLLANDLLSGGKDRTGMVQSNLDEYRAGLLPYTTQDTNPYSNEAFTKYASQLGTDALNTVKGQYAAAGYDPSAMSFGKSVAEGVGRAVAPVWAQERNNLEAQKGAALSAMYGAGNTSAGILSGMDQQSFGNRQAGVDVARSALTARDSPFTRMLDIEAQRRGMPLQNIAQLQSLILPMAQLGGTSNTDSFSKTTKQASPLEMAQGWLKVGEGVGKMAASMGSGGAGGWF